MIRLPAILLWGKTGTCYVQNSKANSNLAVNRGGPSNKCLFCCYDSSYPSTYFLNEKNYILITFPIESSLWQGIGSPFESRPRWAGVQLSLFVDVIYLLKENVNHRTIGACWRAASAYSPVINYRSLGIWNLGKQFSCNIFSSWIIFKIVDVMKSTLYNFAYPTQLSK